MHDTYIGTVPFHVITYIDYNYSIKCQKYNIKGRSATVTQHGNANPKEVLATSAGGRGGGKLVLKIRPRYIPIWW